MTKAKDVQFKIHGKTIKPAITEGRIKYGGHYILNNQNQVVKCKDTAKWAQWLEVNDRMVAKDEIFLDIVVYVSTVFLGLDHQYDEGLPLVFETMVFDGEHNTATYRYSTWDEAMAGHQEVIKMVLGISP